MRAQTHIHRDAETGHTHNTDVQACMHQHRTHTYAGTHSHTDTMNTCMDTQVDLYTHTHIQGYTITWTCIKTHTGLRHTHTDLRYTPVQLLQCPHHPNPSIITVAISVFTNFCLGCCLSRVCPSCQTVQAEDTGALHHLSVLRLFPSCILTACGVRAGELCLCIWKCTFCSEHGCHQKVTGCGTG